MLVLDEMYQACRVPKLSTECISVARSEQETQYRGEPKNACPHVLYTVMMVTALVCLAFCGLSKGASIYPHDVVDELAEQAAANMKAYLAQNPQSGCTVEKTAKRMEWSDLSVEDSTKS
ncbi:hypothetical protein P8C59_005789 [Phyllachora maydis]|uniref:Uncharacterized protein n=1 Tax=Phyllachora maydis TaxID=1825666 RepID=A0AAD9I6C1_9PEZI|nr:hypothetical protein P8C59_005789 [Phyllachora maydis]